MRRKKHAEHVNHERWLVSYADFITLLFAFFVVMFAVSQVDSKKVGRFTESFSRAVGVELFVANGRGILPGTQGMQVRDQTTGHDETPATVELEGLRMSLQARAQRDAEIAGVQVVQRRNELVLRLPENIFFDSGDDAVQEAAARVLRVIAAELRPRRVEVRVEGHTDNRPIRTARYRSNWELSTARSTSVLAKLITEGELQPERLSAAGYGEFHPIATNDTEPGRQQNRRVDLVVTAMLEPSEDPPQPAP
ncbi:MAG: OmpA family protein [Deltaproteobacteria bacterium]|nr:OmpA family protein [Deltaproteobacteria bacterium]